MAYMPFVMLAMSAASAVMQYSASQNAAEAQEAAARREQNLARRNAERQRLETAEAARRLKKQQESAKGTARARLAATGLTLAGSPSSFLDEMSIAMEDELTWLETSGKSKADILELGGQNRYLSGMAQASAIEAQGFGGAFGALAGGLGTAYDQGVFGTP